MEVYGGINILGTKWWIARFLLVVDIYHLGHGVIRSIFLGGEIQLSDEKFKLTAGCLVHKRASTITQLLVDLCRKILALLFCEHLGGFLVRCRKGTRFMERFLVCVKSLDNRELRTCPPRFRSAHC